MELYESPPHIPSKDFAEEEHPKLWAKISIFCELTNGEK
jgi:hypothetical protein